MLGLPTQKEVQDLTKVLAELLRIQAETNKMLKQLSADNSQFLSTLLSFLSHEDQRKMREDIKAAEQALSRTPTKYDAVY